MKLKIAALALIAGVPGCASMLGNGMDQFYEGEPLPADQVSIIEFNGEAGWGKGNGVSVMSIDGKTLSFLSQSKQALKPGKHELLYECDLNPKVMDGKRDGRMQQPSILNRVSITGWLVS